MQFVPNAFSVICHIAQLPHGQQYVRRLECVLSVNICGFLHRDSYLEHLSCCCDSGRVLRECTAFPRHGSRQTLQVATLVVPRFSRRWFNVNVCALVCTASIPIHGTSSLISLDSWHLRRSAREALASHPLTRREEQCHQYDLICISHTFTKSCHSPQSFAALPWL